MTDLDKHVNQPGRAKLVKQVRSKINELGIEYIFFQFISVTGRVVGKGIPTDHWERTCLLYTSPSPRDRQKSRMPSSA